MENFHLNPRQTGDSSNLEASQFSNTQIVETEWRGMTTSGSNFTTRDLRLTNAHRCAFQPTAAVVLFYCLFLVIGVIACIGFFAASSDVGKSIGSVLSPSPTSLAVGIVFVLIGIYLLHHGARPIVFDTRIGWFVIRYRFGGLASLYSKYSYCTWGLDDSVLSSRMRKLIWRM